MDNFQVKRWQDFARANQLGIAKIQAAFVPLSTVHHRALVESVAIGSLALEAAKSTISSKVQPAALSLTLGTTHHALLIGSVVGAKLPIDIGQSIMGTKWPSANLGSTFATACLGLSAGQLCKGIAIPGVASLVAQMNKPISGWILDEIADRMDEQHKMYDNINPLGKRQKLNRRDFNDLLVPGGKGRKKPGANDGLDRYILCNN